MYVVCPHNARGIELLNYLFHGTCGAFALATIVLLVAFRRVRDPGYAVLGLVSLLALVGSRRRLNFVVPKRTHTVKGNASEIRQVIINLVVNAKDASEEGSTIMISVEDLSKDDARTLRLASERHVKISIHDTGSGIQDTHMPRIFDSFYTTKRHGTGLGLPISKMIIENHGGRIDVHSVPSAGTTVTIYLPALDDVEEQQEDADFRTALENGSFCLELKSDTKRGIIEEMINAMTERGQLPDCGAAFEAVLGRERSMSTGMQNGVAFPHGKTRTVDSMVVAFGLKKSGVDFGALDGQLSKIFVMTISPPDTSGAHVRYLATLCKLLESSDTRVKLLSAVSQEDVVRILTE